MKRLNQAYAKGDAEAIGNLVRQWEIVAVRARHAVRLRPRAGAAGRGRARRAAAGRGARLRPRAADGGRARGDDDRPRPAGRAARAGRGRPGPGASPPRGTGHIGDQARSRERRSPGSVPITRRNAMTTPKARTWMAWLLLAVFVALAGLTAAAVARAGQAPERPGVRRPGRLRRRLGDHRRAPDGRPHAGRPHAARLAAGHGAAPSSSSWYRSMGVDQRFSGVAGFGYIEIARDGAARRLPARPAPVLLPAAAQRRRPRHGRHARRS